MFVKKFRISIYFIILFVIFINLVYPLFSYAIDQDGIYVWSNNSSSISTSTNSSEKTTKNSISQDNSRKFFRNNFWECNFNGSKNWKSSI